MSVYVEAEITIKRRFILSDEEACTMKEQGIIPELINVNVPRAINGWTIESLAVVGPQGKDLMK